MAKTIVLDIETVPRPGIMDTWYPQWAGKKYPEKEGEELERMAALHAEFGMVCAVAYAPAYSKEAPVAHTASSVEEEESLLLDLSEALDGGATLVGHNIKGFDIPFLAKRYLAHFGKVPAPLNVAGMKPWEIKHRDTMEYMRFGGDASMSLRSACLLLGIDDPKDGCCGSDVYDLFRAGEITHIGEYCIGDVIAERELFAKLDRLG